MQNRRQEQRTLCADLVDVSWRDRSGRTHRAIATLEDISRSGARLQIDRPIAQGTSIRISYPKGELHGRVRYCAYREAGYFLGVQFEPGVRWSLRQFRPRHFLDPGRLLARVMGRRFLLS